MSSWCDLRFLCFWVGNVLLSLLLGMVNSKLGGYSFFMYVGALYVIIPAFYLKSFWGMLCVFLTGLACDAWQSDVGEWNNVWVLGFGYAFSACIIRAVNRRYEWLLRYLAQLVNLALWFLMLWVSSGWSLSYSFAEWIKIFVDIGISQVVLFVCFNWFLKLQQSLGSLVVDRDVDKGYSGEEVLTR